MIRDLYMLLRVAFFFLNNQLQTRPHIIDCANFDVNEAKWQRDFSDRVFRNICWYFGRFLWPRDLDDRIVLYFFQ